ncbi:MAG: ABC transporter permease [Firmicutes bacterium]|nr:ABC transporter permease [Bacillota bacterium]
MRMVGIIWSIIKKDFYESIRNKTILIVILLPILASLLFTVIDKQSADKNFNIGISGDKGFEIGHFIEDNLINFIPHSYEQVTAGRRAIEEGSLDALLVINDKESKDYLLYLSGQHGLTYLFIKDSVEEILESYHGVIKPFKFTVRSINNPATRLSFLPIWLTITITMIGVLIISGNFAEEKENKTMEAMMITPASSLSIFLAKGIYGLILSSLTVFLMCILNGVVFVNWIILFVFIITILSSSACFTAIGLLIGIITTSQSSARSIGTVVYFPLLFPTLIYDLTEFTRALAGLFPTYYLFKALERILLYPKNISGLFGDVYILLGFAVIFSILAYFIFKGVKN